jgi:hypothetical protein
MARNALECRWGKGVCTLSFSKKAFSVTKKKSRAKAPGAMNTFSASLAKGPPGRYCDAL